MLNCDLYKLIFAIEYDHYECCTPWPWPKMSRSHIFNINISETVRAIAENVSYVFYRSWYLPSNGTIVTVVHPLPWPSCLRSNIFILCICLKNDAQATDVPDIYASTPTALAVGLLLFGMPLQFDNRQSNFGPYFQGNRNWYILLQLRNVLARTPTYILACV